MPASKYPFNAKTNKKTTLINLLGNPLALAKDTPLTVFNEKGIFGEVTVVVSGATRGGAVLKADYDPA